MPDDSISHEQWRETVEALPAQYRHDNFIIWLASTCSQLGWCCPHPGCDIDTVYRSKAHMKRHFAAHHPDVKMSLVKDNLVNLHKILDKALRAGSVRHGSASKFPSAAAAQPPPAPVSASAPIAPRSAETYYPATICQLSTNPLSPGRLGFSAASPYSPSAGISYPQLSFENVIQEMPNQMNGNSTGLPPGPLAGFDDSFRSPPQPSPQRSTPVPPRHLDLEQGYDYAEPPRKKRMRRQAQTPPRAAVQLQQHLQLTPAHSPLNRTGSQHSQHSQHDSHSLSAPDQYQYGDAQQSEGMGGWRPHN